MYVAMAFGKINTFEIWMMYEKKVWQSFPPFSIMLAYNHKKKSAQYLFPRIKNKGQPIFRIQNKCGNSVLLLVKWNLASQQFY